MIAGLLAFAGNAIAEEASENGAQSGPGIEAPRVSDRHDRVLFGSVELAEVSIFSGSGIKYSLSGDVEAPGPIAMAMTNIGATRERWEGPDDFVAYLPRLTRITRVYFGRQGNTPLGFLTLAGGAEILRKQEFGADALPRWQEPKVGAAFLGELWREAPLPDGTGFGDRDGLIHVSVMAGTAAPSVWARVAGGVAVADGVFAGPELAGYLEPDYREWRIGAHVTGMRLGPLHLRFSGGMVMPEGGRSDVYLGLQGHFLR
ncbi:MAG: cellulose biosynthesis protein BcsS [Salinarimonas sp.]|nr:cellulose biosynthesis protein BcsS [Salinarimonas sp.]